MINFPVLDGVKVDGYDLYPGSSEAAGLIVDLTSSTSVILGANGLGKSTLIEIMFRLLSGPFDLPKLSSTEGLGNANLVATRIPGAGRNYFGNRVLDGARNSVATLNFSLGDATLSVSRSLHDLSISGLTIDGDEVVASEAAFQERVCELAGLGSFADWILVLRFVTFYMDDRRALIWDRSAQRQLLRPLFLSVEDARQWTIQERAILELDSRRRNLNVALNREERAIADETGSDQTPDQLRAEIATLQSTLAEDAVLREELETDHLASAEQLAKRRLDSLRLELMLDTAKRKFEHAKLASLAARFPEHAASAQYVFGSFLATDNCFLCGHEEPQLREAMERRIENHTCAFCGTPVDPFVPDNISDISDARAYSTQAEYADAAAEYDVAKASVDDVQKSLDSLRLKQAELDAGVTTNDTRLRQLILRLPRAERGGAEAEGGLATLRARVRTMNTELADRAATFRLFVDEQRNYIYQQASELEATFGRYSHEFLFENAQLSRTEREEKLGQSAFRVSFPAYELELANSGSALMEIRSASNEVSESQKEFVDLAFRMSLISIAGVGGRGTIVIDTPESSLDAVFAERAALVLARFANDHTSSRLVLASNFTESSLIPELLSEVSDNNHSLNVVDLRAFARGTAATVALSWRYDEALQEMAGPYL